MPILLVWSRRMWWYINAGGRAITCCSVQARRAINRLISTWYTRRFWYAFVQEKSRHLLEFPFASPLCPFTATRDGLWRRCSLQEVHLMERKVGHYRRLSLRAIFP